MALASRDPARLSAKSTWASRVRAYLEVLGVGVTDDILPERVQRAIRSQEETSEILVCLVQLAAIVFFAVLYSLAPKAFPPDVPFEPVPWTLAIYGGFTLLRLWLAVRRRLQPWFLSLSVIVDISVLMVTIWSFHLQYQAPPALYLKAPTFMYVFILIALRALRFDALYVLLAGAATVVSWLLLVGYAFYYGDPSVTYSFVDYAASYRILLGAGSWLSPTRRQWSVPGPPATPKADFNPLSSRASDIRTKTAVVRLRQRRWPERARKRPEIGLPAGPHGSDK